MPPEVLIKEPKRLEFQVFLQMETLPEIQNKALHDFLLVVAEKSESSFNFFKRFGLYLEQFPPIFTEMAKSVIKTSLFSNFYFQKSLGEFVSLLHSDTKFLEDCYKANGFLNTDALEIYKKYKKPVPDFLVDIQKQVLTPFVNENEIIGNDFYKDLDIKDTVALNYLFLNFHNNKISNQETNTPIRCLDELILDPKEEYEKVKPTITASVPYFLGAMRLFKQNPNLTASDLDKKTNQVIQLLYGKAPNAPEESCEWLNKTFGEYNALEGMGVLHENVSSRCLAYFLSENLNFLKLYAQLLQAFPFFQDAGAQRGINYMLLRESLQFVTYVLRKPEVIKQVLQQLQKHYEAISEQKGYDPPHLPHQWAHNVVLGVLDVAKGKKCNFEFYKAFELSLAHPKTLEPFNQHHFTDFRALFEWHAVYSQMNYRWTGHDFSIIKTIYGEALFEDEFELFKELFKVTEGDFRIEKALLNKCQNKGAQIRKQFQPIPANIAKLLVKPEFRTVLHELINTIPDSKDGYNITELVQILNLSAEEREIFELRINSFKSMKALKKEGQKTFKRKEVFAENPAVDEFFADVAKYQLIKHPHWDGWEKAKEIFRTNTELQEFLEPYFHIFDGKEGDMAQERKKWDQIFTSEAFFLDLQYFAAGKIKNKQMYQAYTLFFQYYYTQTVPHTMSVTDYIDAIAHLKDNNLKKYLNFKDSFLKKGIETKEFEVVILLLANLTLSEVKKVIEGQKIPKLEEAFTKKVSFTVSQNVLLPPTANIETISKKVLKKYVTEILINKERGLPNYFSEIYINITQILKGMEDNNQKENHLYIFLCEVEEIIHQWEKMMDLNHIFVKHNHKGGIEHKQKQYAEVIGQILFESFNFKKLPEKLEYSIALTLLDATLENHPHLALFFKQCQQQGVAEFKYIIPKIVDLAQETLIGIEKQFAFIKNNEAWGISDQSVEKIISRAKKIIVKHTKILELQKYLKESNQASLKSAVKHKVSVQGSKNELDMAYAKETCVSKHTEEILNPDFIPIRLFLDDIESPFGYTWVLKDHIKGIGSVLHITDIQPHDAYRSVLNPKDFFAGMVKAVAHYAQKSSIKFKAISMTTEDSAISNDSTLKLHIQNLQKGKKIYKTEKNKIFPRKSGTNISQAVIIKKLP